MESNFQGADEEWGARQIRGGRRYPSLRMDSARLSPAGITRTFPPPPDRPGHSRTFSDSSQRVRADLFVGGHDGTVRFLVSSLG